MVVRDLKKGMVLKFSPKLRDDFLHTCAFIAADSYLFFTRMGIYETERCKKGPFLYLGHRYGKVKNKKTGKNNRFIIREVMCEGRVYAIWGHDFKHLEPI